MSTSICSIFSAIADNDQSTDLRFRSVSSGTELSKVKAWILGFIEKIFFFFAVCVSRRIFYQFSASFSTKREIASFFSISSKVLFSVCFRYGIKIAILFLRTIWISCGTIFGMSSQHAIYSHLKMVRVMPAICYKYAYILWRFCMKNDSTVLEYLISYSIFLRACA